MHANKKQFLAILSLLLILLPSVVLAAFVSGSTGADGAFAPTINTVLQIPESGLFNFTTVTIPTDVTVTFTKNTQNTPVTILATGDVTVNGTISLNGADASNSIPGAGGSGGFDGGQGGTANKSGNNGGGPGGGKGGAPSIASPTAGGSGGGAGYFLAGDKGGTTPINSSALVSGATPGAGGSGGGVYGNERIIPAIGGSGGGGGGGTDVYPQYTAHSGGGGGGGGGALVIASSGVITINGGITVNGGKGANGETAIYLGSPVNFTYYYGGGGGGGSGGSIRLISNTLTGNGTLSAVGGNFGYGWLQSGGVGSVGRIRFEAETVQRTAATTPPLTLSYPNAVEPPNMPSLKISAIGGVSVPSVPKGSFGAPDVILPFNTKNPVTVTVSATNIPLGQTVTVSSTPSGGEAASTSGTLSGTEASSSVDVSLNISTAYPSLITATVTYQLAAMKIKDFYIAGEKVERVRVAANLGGKSSVTYITASGREIPVY